MHKEDESKGICGERRQRAGFLNALPASPTREQVHCPVYILLLSCQKRWVFSFGVVFIYLWATDKEQK